MAPISYPRRPLPLWQSQFLVGILVAFSSQLYFLPLVDGSIRISAAVVLYPIFLLTLLRDKRTLETGIITAVTVILLRFVEYLYQGTDSYSALILSLPGGLYYLFYAIVFHQFRWHPKGNRPQLLLSALVVCDMVSNFLELVLSLLMGITPNPSLYFVGSLSLVAILRSAIATAILWWLGYCRRLLAQEEHEERYQRLFLMTAQLKTEVYLLENTTEQIETVMSNAYQLYETLDKMHDLPQNLSELALSITRDIHEIKKSDLRVLKGLEKGLDELYDQECLRFSDLLHILVASCHNLISPNQIILKHRIQQDFSTNEHYTLMSILHNLTHNAIEAIESTGKSGTIDIVEKSQGDNFRITVSDDGPGMSERAQQIVFQMGYSTKFNPLTGDMNRGVGLCTVRTLVENLGGDISVHSELGKGTTFTIIIPKKALEVL